MKAGARLGLGFQADKRAADYGRLAAAAEHYGFEVLSVFGDLYFQPPLPALLAMARATSKVRLGPACLNPFMVHPVEIAGQVVALDQASGGRAFLGLARGAWLGDLGVDQSGALQAVEESVAIVNALLAGATEGVKGARFSLPPGAVLRGPPPLRRRVPLLIGTWGRRLAAVAARVADEVKVGGSANPDMARMMRQWTEAVPTGREGRPRVVMGAVTVVGPDGHEARARARREVAMYLDVVLALDPTFEAPPDLSGRVNQALRRSGPAGAAGLVPDDVLARFAFAGTPESVAGQAISLLEAGADRVDFGTPHGLTDDQGVELLGQRVLPMVREALGPP